MVFCWKIDGPSRLNRCVRVSPSSLSKKIADADASTKSTWPALTRGATKSSWLQKQNLSFWWVLLTERETVHERCRYPHLPLPSRYAPPAQLTCFPGGGSCSSPACCSCLFSAPKSQAVLIVRGALLGQALLPRALCRAPRVRIVVSHAQSACLLALSRVSTGPAEHGPGQARSDWRVVSMGQ
jgi:hypothetical protein